MTLFAAEFQNYLFTEFKRLPIPKELLKNKSILNEQFWSQEQVKFAHLCQELLSSMLTLKETAFIIDAIPKVEIPLTNAAIYRKEFDPLSLVKIILDKRLAKLYAQSKIPCKGKIGSFTWVMPDGYGDWVAQKKGLEILLKRERDLTINALTLYESSWKGLIEGSGREKDNKIKYLFVSYEKSKASETHASLAKQFAEHMSGIEWLLEFPTHYIGLDDLLKKNNYPTEILGQYGFLLASPFSPKERGRSMGLHPCEVGVLFREGGEIKSDFDLPILPYPYDRMALSYLKTKRGALTYLYLTAYLQKKTGVSVALFMPTFAAIQDLLKDENLLNHLGKIAKGKVFFRDINGNTFLHGEGKVCLQIVELGPCSEEELFGIAALSTFPIGCRGDQSFTEALSLRKPFFYDPPAHARNFLIDLEGFARNYTLSKTLPKWFQGSLRVLEEDDPEVLGKELASLYQNQDELFSDFTDLGDAAFANANGNQYIHGRCKRRFFLKNNPHLALEEAALYESLKHLLKRKRVDKEALAAWDHLRKSYEEKIQ